MDELEAPSFSLGFDLDFDTEPEPRFQNQNPVPDSFTAPQNANAIGANSERHQQQHKEDGENEEELWGDVMDSDPEAGLDPPRILKRLRRGGGGFEKKRDSELSCGNNSDDRDDDIEEFSSPEDFVSKDECPSRQFSSVCSSSKVSLRGSGVLITHSSNERNIRKREHDSKASSSATARTPLQGSLFPKLTVSPLRKFQLIESDSDDPCESVGKKVFENKEQSTESKKKSTAMGRTQNDDLWEDFFSTKSFSIPTPALDNFCEEYYQMGNEKDKAFNRGECSNENKAYHPNKISGQKFEQCWDLSNPRPPAHRYFFHDDLKIQKLVRSRLPNFFPLGTTSTRGNDLSTTSHIDYLGQFTNAKTPKQKGNHKTTRGSSSTRGRKRSNIKEVPEASQGWVDPRSATIPKDAGRKRVNGSNESAGHWHTSPEGRKVYISKTGQELTGQSAYRQYRKECGKAFKKTGKKSTTKNKK